MLTLAVVTNWVGTRSEKIKMLLICVLIDLTYIVPIIIIKN